jgi:hypothetical protein
MTDTNVHWIAANQREEATGLTPILPQLNQDGEASIFTHTTTMAERSKHQQKIIKNYYENRDSIALQRLQELVTELYLATGKKRQQHWKSIVLHLGKLGVAKERIEILQKKDDAAEVAKLVAELAAKA